MQRAPSFVIPFVLGLIGCAGDAATGAGSAQARAREPEAAVVEVAARPDLVQAPAKHHVLAQQLRELEQDPSPPSLTNETHYWASNERRADLFRPDVDGLGGVYVGVGADQSYLIAGWQAPELMVVIDFDQDVVDLHAIYGVFFGVADGPARMLALWEDEEAAHPLLEHDPARLALYGRARSHVARRLADVRARYAELGVSSWLDDPEQYARVASLHREGRVVALRGDFTLDGVVRRVAEQLTAAGETVRVLYLSNVEQYLTYRQPFRENMLALPFDGASLVLRTLPGRPAGFEYLLQSGAHFHAWLRSPRVWSVYRMRGYRRGEPLVAAQRHVLGGPPP